MATTPAENVALVEELTAAFEAGDAEIIDAILADDLSYELDRYGLPHDPASNFAYMGWRIVGARRHVVLWVAWQKERSTRGAI